MSLLDVKNQKNYKAKSQLYSTIEVKKKITVRELILLQGVYRTSSNN